jgi:hypothetical protein
MLPFLEEEKKTPKKFKVRNKFNKLFTVHGAAESCGVELILGGLWRRRGTR